MKISTEWELTDRSYTLSKFEILPDGKPFSYSLGLKKPQIIIIIRSKWCAVLLIDPIITCIKMCNALNHCSYKMLTFLLKGVVYDLNVVIS